MKRMIMVLGLLIAGCEYAHAGAIEKKPHEVKVVSQYVGSWKGDKAALKKVDRTSANLLLSSIFPKPTFRRSI